MTDGFEKVADFDDLPDGIPYGAEMSDGTPVCLIRVGDEVYAVQDRCTHAEFPMRDGDMVDDFVIECGLHGAQFDVRTGEVLELPATDQLPCYQVKVENGSVHVRRETQDGVG